MAGGSLQLEGPAKEPAWTTLAEDAPIGSTLLQLAQAANWQVGPPVVLPSACPSSTCLAWQHVPRGGAPLCDTWYACSFPDVWFWHARLVLAYHFEHRL